MFYQKINLHKHHSLLSVCHHDESSVTTTKRRLVVFHFIQKKLLIEKYPKLNNMCLMFIKENLRFVLKTIIILF